MALGCPAGAIPQLMLTFRAVISVAKSSEILALEVDSPSELLPTRHFLITRLSFSVVKRDALVLRNVLVKRCNPHRFNILAYPLGLVGLQLDRSSFPDAAPLVVEQDVLTRFGTHSQKNTMVPPMIFNLLLCSMFITAFLSEA